MLNWWFYKSPIEPSGTPATRLLRTYYGTTDAWVSLIARTINTSLKSSLFSCSRQHLSKYFLVFYLLQSAHKTLHCVGEHISLSLFFCLNHKPPPQSRRINWTNSSVRSMELGIVINELNENLPVMDASSYNVSFAVDRILVIVGISNPDSEQVQTPISAGACRWSGHMPKS